MDEFNQLVAKEIIDINRFLDRQNSFNNGVRRFNKAVNRKYNKLVAFELLVCISLGYSVYAQASKIESLQKEIEELKKNREE